MAYADSYFDAISELNEELDRTAFDSSTTAELEAIESTIERRAEQLEHLEILIRELKVDQLPPDRIGAFLNLRLTVLSRTWRQQSLDRNLSRAKDIRERVMYAATHYQSQTFLFRVAYANFVYREGEELWEAYDTIWNLSKLESDRRLQLHKERAKQLPQGSPEKPAN